jgi:2-furoyl-CoA dehydrogenase large subunit
MHGALTGAYAIANLAVRNRIVLTNRTPTGLVRGFGGPQVYFALERLIQRIAVELGMDVLDVYRRNFVQSFPYRAAAGALFDSGDYAKTLELACGRADWEALQARRDARAAKAVSTASAVRRSSSLRSRTWATSPPRSRRQSAPAPVRRTGRSPPRP